MEQRAITQMEKSRKMEKAEEKFRQQIAVYERACKEEKDRVRKTQDRHKYMMGGCVLKYFPEGYNAYEFDEQEMNRIIACAFSFAGVVNMIKTVIKERPVEGQEAETTDDQSKTAETGESDSEEDDYDEAESDDVMPCSKVSRAIPKEEQIIIEGRHDPIVSKEDWLKAQEVIRKISSPVRTRGRNYPLKGVARCGCCGRALQYYSKKKVSHFKCNASKYDPNTNCFVAKISEDAINEAVLYAIQGAMDCTAVVEKRVQDAKRHSGTKALDSMNQIKALQVELDRCEEQRMHNIERLNTGDMSKDDYLSERDELNSKIEDLKRRLMECQSRKQEAETAEDPEIQRFLDASSKYKGQQELTNDMVKAFIERVLIYDPERIEIKWNFSDRLLGMME